MNKIIKWFKSRPLLSAFIIMFIATIIGVIAAASLLDNLGVLDYINRILKG